MVDLQQAGAGVKEGQGESITQVQAANHDFKLLTTHFKLFTTDR
jgi:hypothetical protein